MLLAILLACIMMDILCVVVVMTLGWIIVASPLLLFVGLVLFDLLALILICIFGRNKR